MNFSTLVASLLNLFGWDGLIIGVVWVIMILSFIRFLRRRGGSRRSSISPAERLRRLDSLRDQGSISAREYSEQRRRILSEL